MAGKISDLGGLTAAQAAVTDTIEVRDVSDTSMAVTGTNKAMQLGELRAFAGEVHVGPSDPGFTQHDLWYDSDAPDPYAAIETAADGNLQLDYYAAPVPPPASMKVKIVNIKIGGGALPFYILPTGRPALIAPANWIHGSSQPSYGSSTVQSDGLAAMTAVGTASAAVPTAVSAFSRARRMEYLVTVASPTAVAGFRSGSALAYMGDGTGAGGFIISQRWGPATGVTGATTHRGFCGMMGTSSGPTDVEPSSLSDMFGMGWDAADTQVQIMCNDASGTASKFPLGASWPKPSADRTDFYECIWYQEFADPYINYMITNLRTGEVVDGALSSDIPAGMTSLFTRLQCSVGGTSSVVGVGHFGFDSWVCQ